MFYSTRKLEVISGEPFWANPFFLDKWFWRVDQQFLAWLARILSNAVSANRTSKDAISESEGLELLTRLDAVYWPTIDRLKAIAANAIFSEFSPEQVAEAFQIAREPVFLEPIPAHHFNPLAWHWFGLSYRLTDDITPWPEFHEDKKRWYPPIPEDSDRSRVIPAKPAPAAKEKTKPKLAGDGLFGKDQDHSATRQ